MNTLTPVRGSLRRQRDPDDPPEPLEREEDGGLDLRSALYTLWRGKWIVLACVAAGLALAGVHLSQAVPLYTAEAQVRFLTEEERVTDLESVVSGISPEGATLNTERMVLTSHRLLGRVVDEAELTEDPEFAPASAGAAVAGEDPLPGAGGDVNPTRVAAIKALRNKLNVTVVPNSYVLSIRIETTDALKSATIANAVAAGYVQSQLEGKFDATRRATAWLSEEVAGLKTELEAAEAAVEDFVAASPQVSEGALQRAAGRVENLRQRRRERLDRQASMSESLADAATLREVEDFAGAAERLGDATLARLAGQIGSATGAEGSQLVARFDARFAERTEALEGEASALERQAETLAEAIGEAEARVDARGGELIELRQLEREAEATRLLYEHFLSRVKETSVQQGVQQADSEVLAWAIPPEVPSYPDRSGTMLRAGVLALVLGAGLVFLVEHLNRRIRTPEELEELVGLPVAGVVPAAPDSAPLSYLVDRPTSALAESLRSLRTSLVLSNLDRPPQVVMMTSSLPGEGKTTTLLMLAQITAQMGSRTLVIESDIRRPKFRKVLAPERETGLLSSFRKRPEQPEEPAGDLLSVLGGTISVEDALHRDTDSGLDILFARQSKASAADIFSSDRFSSFIDEMRGRYDWIFLDTPPVLLVPDARIVAQAADAVVYAVRWNRTTRDQVTSGVKLLAQAHVRVGGLALTRTDTKAIASYGYYGYGSSYGYGSAYYTN